MGPDFFSFEGSNLMQQIVAGNCSGISLLHEVWFGVIQGGPRTDRYKVIDGVMGPI